jgi:hypothetical protein
MFGHRGKQCFAVSVVPIRRRVADPGHPLNVAQHHRLRPARPGEFDGVLEKRLAQIPVVIGVGAGTGSSRGQWSSFRRSGMFTRLTSLRAGLGA